MIIGLTGPSGGGKSTVCEIAEKYYRVKIIDCDEYARRAVCPEMIKKLADRFGDDILDNKGNLNRKALASKAFANQKATDDLNAITHPYIVNLIRRDILPQENVIVDAPTLFESGLDSQCDLTVAVLALKEERSRRIVLRDNLTESQLYDRQNAAKPDEFYAGKADKIIVNDGDLFALEGKVKALFFEIFGGPDNE